MSGDFPDARCCPISSPQRRPHEVQSLQPRISAGAHSQELRTVYSQIPLRHAYGRHKLVGSATRCPMRCQDLLEPCHDLGAMPPHACVSVRLLARQTRYQRMQQFLLERARDFWMRNQITFGLGEATGLPMQAEKFRYCFWRRP